MTLAQSLPIEMDRCRKIRENAREIGNPGVFLAALLDISIRKAEEAIMHGDTVTMLRAYEDLRTFKA